MKAAHSSPKIYEKDKKWASELVKGPRPFKRLLKNLLNTTFFRLLKKKKKEKERVTGSGFRVFSKFGREWHVREDSCLLPLAA